MYFLLQAHLSHLKPGLPHSDAKGFCLRAARDHTAIIIHRYTFYTLKCYEKPF